MEPALEDLENSQFFHTAKNNNNEKLCSSGKIKGVAGQLFTRKRLWVWFMDSVHHLSRYAARLDWKGNNWDKNEGRVCQISEILQDRPIGLSSFEHALFFKKREDRTWRWFRSWQAATATTEPDNTGQGGVGLSPPWLHGVELLPGLQGWGPLLPSAERVTLPFWA